MGRNRSDGASVKESGATSCPDCETIDIAACAAAAFYNDMERSRSAAATIFCDSNRSNPSCDVTRFRRRAVELGEFSSFVLSSRTVVVAVVRREGTAKKLTPTNLVESLPGPAHYK